MNIDTNTIVPISLANQNFSKVTRLVDQLGRFRASKRRKA